MAVLLPAVVLIAVVAVAVVGRTGDPGRDADHAGTAAQAAAPASTPGATEGPVATTSPRSDWPAAISGRAAPTATVPPLPREHGTDGLMGRLPFGLPNDTPTIRVERANRFTLDDVQATWSGFDTTPPWVRRLGGLANFRTDPYQR
jgi:hypothetical protein